MTIQYSLSLLIILNLWMLCFGYTMEKTRKFVNNQQNEQYFLLKQTNLGKLFIDLKDIKQYLDNNEIYESVHLLIQQIYDEKDFEEQIYSEKSKLNDQLIKQFQNHLNQYQDEAKQIESLLSFDLNNKKSKLEDSITSKSKQNDKSLKIVDEILNNREQDKQNMKLKIEGLDRTIYIIDELMSYIQKVRTKQMTLSQAQDTLNTKKKNLLEVLNKDSFNDVKVRLPLLKVIDDLSFTDAFFDNEKLSSSKINQITELRKSAFEEKNIIIKQDESNQKETKEKLDRFSLEADLSKANLIDFNYKKQDIEESIEYLDDMFKRRNSDIARQNNNGQIQLSVNNKENELHGEIKIDLEDKLHLLRQCMEIIKSDLQDLNQQSSKSESMLTARAGVL